MANIPRWEGYKSFFHFAIFRYLVLWFALVPIVATLLNGIEGPIEFTIEGRTFVIALTLPFAWQLLWLSSLFYLCALALYYARCPRFIKDYNSFTDYQARSHDARWLAREASELRDAEALRKFANRLSTKGFIVEMPAEFRWVDNPVVERLQTKVYFEVDGRKWCLGMPVLDGEENVKVDAEKGIFWEIFGRLSESRRGSRVTIYVLLALSAVLFAIVLVEHVWHGYLEVWAWAMPLLSSLARLANWGG